jgi:hypothetical protein
LTSSENPHLHPVHPLIREQGTGNREQGTGNKTQKNREKFYFQVLTKDLKYVILILIRKNYLKF